MITIAGIVTTIMTVTIGGTMKTTIGTRGTTTTITTTSDFLGVHTPLRRAPGCAWKKSRDRIPNGEWE
jgi:hypothetical protein